MKPFNSALNSDITKLKELFAVKGPKNPEYKEMFSGIMQRHNLSRSTVYTELCKDTPGSYKKTDRKSWMVKISPREMDLVAELVVTGKKNHDICKAMSLEMGFNYTLRRLIKTRQKIATAAAVIIKNDPKIIKHVIKTIPSGIKSLLDMENPQKTNYNPRNNNSVNTPSAGSSKTKGCARKFFYELSGIDLSNLKSIISLNFYGSEKNVSASVIKECLDHIAASSEADGKNIYELTKFDIETLLLQQLKYAKLNQYISPVELKQLTAIHKTLLLHEENSVSGGYTLDDVFRVVQRFSPNATREEVAKILGA